MSPAPSSRPTAAGRRAGLALVLLAGVLPGCDLTGAELDEIEAYVQPGLVWDSPTIHVCWDNPGADDATARGWVKDAVSQTWQAASKLRFTGWDTCQPSTRGIHIRIAEEQPGTFGAGQELDGQPGGMVLSLAPTDNHEYFVRVQAVHEFGHAIGFEHEQDRLDTPTWCAEAPRGIAGAVGVGAWDADSVMNYCNPRYSGDGQLSATDLWAVQLVYGATWFRDVTIKDVGNGSCLEVIAGSLTEGAPIQASRCADGPGQAWDLVPTSAGQFQIVSAGSYQCLTVAGGSADDGAAIAQARCDGRPSQAFSFATEPEAAGFELVAAHSDKCLDLQGGSAADGTKVLQWWCHGAANQRWRFGRAGK